MNLHSEKKKIAVLVSGGVDSAVVVHKLKDLGHDLQLFYIRIGLDTDEGDCSAEEDIEMCTLIAQHYGLPLEIVSLHEEYWQYVMEYALSTVKQGRTPNPDIMCNRIIKFGFFEQRWGKDYDLTATGHYATTTMIGDTKYLATAADPVKDQTDFLARITYDQLQHLIFPIGNLPKEEVRHIAEQVHLPNAKRKDSQGICFLGQINYNDFIRRHLGENPGPIVELESGKVLGEHRGYWFHTIGQRKGLGLSGGPWFVVRKDVAQNTLYVSHGYDTEKQYGRTLTLNEMHFISGNPFTTPAEPVRITFKNRHTPVFMPGELRQIDAEHWQIHSDVDVQGIAPGQYAVIYDTERHLCYGSAVIEGQ